MNYAIEQEEKYSVYRLNEEKLISSIAPDLKSLFTVESSKGVKSMVLDLEQVHYCDSSGLSAILVGNRFCRDNGGTFVLSGMQDGVKKVIQISQLDKVLHITPTVNEAVDLIFMEEVERELGAEDETV